MATKRIKLHPALALLGTAMLLTAPGLANAQPRGGPSSLHSGTLEVPLNKSEVVSTDRTIAKAMIGNEEVADILPISDRSVYVLGKKMGTTSLTLFDPTGRVITVMDVAVGPDIEALGAQLRELVPGEPIEARISNESIILTGLVNDAGAASRAAQLAKAYAGDKVVNLISVGSSQQIMLEVRFAEVNRSIGKDIGVSSFVSDSNGFRAAIGKGASLVAGKDTTVTTTSGGTTISSVVPGAPILQLAELGSQFGIFRKAFSIGGVSIDATLNSLESKGLAKTLAMPTLVALSGERASFLAGGEFPIPVAQTGGGGGGANAITVEFKPFGVSLGFTPTVLGDKTINLIVEPEVSAIDPAASFTVGNITVPGLRTRRASTTIELRDGESFAIAGLLSKDFQTTVSQIPFLSSIPILGALARSSSFKKGETELLIVVTPHLVAPIKPGAQVKLPTDRVKDPSDVETFLFGEPYHPQKLSGNAPPTATGTAAPQAAAPGSPQAQAPAAQPALPAKDGKSDYAY